MSLFSDNSFIYVFGFWFDFKSFEIITIEIKYIHYSQSWLQYWGSVVIRTLKVHWAGDWVYKRDPWDREGAFDIRGCAR